GAKGRLTRLETTSGAAAVRPYRPRGPETSPQGHGPGIVVLRPRSARVVTIRPSYICNCNPYGGARPSWLTPGRNNEQWRVAAGRHQAGRTIRGPRSCAAASVRGFAPRAAGTCRNT